MLNPTSGPLRSRVLMVDDELAKLDTALGRAAESLAAALETRNLDVVRALSYEDGHAIVGSDASLRAVLLRLEPRPEHRWHACAGDRAAA